MARIGEPRRGRVHPWRPSREAPSPLVRPTQHNTDPPATRVHTRDQAPVRHVHGDPPHSRPVGHVPTVEPTARDAASGTTPLNDLRRNRRRLVRGNEPGRSSAQSLVRGPCAFENISLLRGVRQIGRGTGCSTRRKAREKLDSAQKQGHGLSRLCERAGLVLRRLIGGRRRASPGLASVSGGLCVTRRRTNGARERWTMDPPLASATVVRVVGVGPSVGPRARVRRHCAEHGPFCSLYHSRRACPPRIHRSSLPTPGNNRW
jgi:hypothetical protein